ncbi:hypothetical protein Esi_0053_0104 [Ectocarpus siliculosus]|uniref:Uncharacterized protein n=1 Tax=Ectocarpus siliculosus TaxID=2880 RepID=D8LPU0_ECTSI|nr:hypothetical protein Esi_0053_0104 [Ectocarpus siliculosus]|eukprot:CBN77395.1 hypothetical protein Esi_0053_0104 [Ectocarpus siliculosus]
MPQQRGPREERWSFGSAAAQMYAMGGVDVRCFSGRGCEGAGGGQQEVVLDMDRRVDILFDVVGRLGKFAVQDDVAKHRFSAWEGETRASAKRIRAFFTAHLLLARSDRFKGAFATAFNRDFEEWALGVAERAFETAPWSGRIPSAKAGDLPPIPPIALDMTWTLFTLAPLMEFLGNSDDDDDDDDVPQGMGGGGASSCGSSNTGNGAGGKGRGHRRLAAARGGEGGGGGITRRTMIAPATENKDAACHAFKESGVCTHAARTRVECKYQHPGGESHEGVVVHAKAGQKRKRG